jgi:hypothetical protein
LQEGVPCTHLLLCGRLGSNSGSWCLRLIKHHRICFSEVELDIHRKTLEATFQTYLEKFLELTRYCWFVLCYYSAILEKHMIVGLRAGFHINRAERMGL